MGRIEKDVGEFPPNFFVRAHVPQETVLPYAQGVICSSTTTPVLGALTHGLPLLLVVTGDGEQPHVSDRTQTAGACVSLHLYDATPDQLATKVDQLLNQPELAINARKLQHSFAIVRKEQLAARAIVRLAYQQPVQRHAYSRVSLSI